MKQILLFLCLAAFSAGCSSDDSASALRPANALVKLIRLDNVGEAYQLMALDYRTRTSFTEFRSKALQLKAAPDAQIQWESPVTDSDRVNLKGRIARENGADAEVHLTFIKEVADWTPVEFDIR